MRTSPITTRAVMAALAAALLACAPHALATQPCGDLGECKALIEINATDGDIGFHFLMDGDDLVSSFIVDPAGELIFEYEVDGPLEEQFLTETFAESAEPLCWADPEADPDELIVTLEEFVARWSAGTYTFTGVDEEGELAEGASALSYALPAAPDDVDFDAGLVTWSAGGSLGNCASPEELDLLVSEGVLPVHPREVVVLAWEIVLEPDVESGDPVGGLVYSIRVPGNIGPLAVTVPADYLASLPDDTPVKVEVGAIGIDDNATFTEADGFCVNEVEGCDEEESARPWRLLEPSGGVLRRR